VRIKRDEFRDPDVQRRVLVSLFEENGPMGIRQLGERIGHHPSIVATNLGELQSHELVRRVEGEAETVTRYEITPEGMMKASHRDQS
jgi:DNA-binding MarR family transcriptional regulator